MAEWFAKVRCRSDDPRFSQANVYLKAIETHLPARTAASYYAAILDTLASSSQHIDALLILLACSLSSITDSIITKELNRIFTTVSTKIYNIIDQDIVGKYTVKIFERLLQASENENEDTRSILNYILHLVYSKSEDTRKQAVLCLTKLIAGRLKTQTQAIDLIVSNIVGSLEDITGNTLQALLFLNSAMQTLPQEKVDDLTARLVDMATQEIDVITRINCFLVLTTTFASHRIANTSDYIASMLNSPPLTTGTQNLQVAYINCISHGVSRTQFIPECISSLSEYLTSDIEAVVAAASNAIHTIIINTDLSEKEDDLAQILDSMSIEDKTELQIITTLLYMLNERFQHIFNSVFPIIETAIGKFGRKDYVIQLVRELIQIGHLWLENDSFGRAIVASVARLGLSTFLQMTQLQILEVPLETMGYMEKSKSWVLPVLAKHLTVGEGAIFASYLFPLSQSLLKMSTLGSEVRQRQYKQLYYQIWDIFPVCCRPGIEPIIPQLSNILVNMADQRTLIANSLCTLNLTQFEARFGPVLFNVYLDSENPAVLRLLKSYEFTPDFLDKKSKKLIEKILFYRQNEFAKVPLCVDLLTVLLGKKQGLDEMEQAIIGELLGLLMQSAQKRCYKLIYVTKDEKLTTKFCLSDEIITCEEKSRLWRLKCIAQFIQILTPDDVKRIFPEILLCVRSTIGKTRRFALQFVEQLADLGQLVSMGVTGLALESTRVSSLILLRYLAPKIDDSAMKVKLLQTVLLLSDQEFQAKEVNNCILKYIKSSLHGIPQSDLLSLLPGLMERVIRYTEAFKSKSRIIVTLLLGLVGYDALDRVFPEKHKALLHYITKTSKKKKKPRTKHHFDREKDDEEKKQKVYTKREAMPTENHFLHPSEIPRAAKKRVIEAEEEFRMNFDNRMVISEPTAAPAFAAKRERDGPTTDAPTKKRKTTTESGVVVTQAGTDYKAKKAQGDKQKQGAPTPFAYVQFNPRMLSKKNKQKVTQQIGEIARKGVFKGIKARKRRANQS